jgi:hypothetical protein
MDYTFAASEILLGDSDEPWIQDGEPSPNLVLGVFHRPVRYKG